MPLFSAIYSRNIRSIVAPQVAEKPGVTVFLDFANAASWKILL